MALLSFTEISPEEMKKFDLLKLENQRVYLTPKEKFDLMVKKATKGSPSRIKRFHFFTVESGIEIVLFDGLGRIIGTYENSVKGERVARLDALELFKDSPKEKQLGGFIFTGYKEWANYTSEIEDIEKSISFKRESDFDHKRQVISLIDLTLSKIPDENKLNERKAFIDGSTFSENIKEAAKIHFD